MAGLLGLLVVGCTDVKREEQVRPKETPVTVNVRSDVGNYASAERWFAIARMNDVAKMVETARVKREQLALSLQPNPSAMRVAPVSTTASGCYDQPYVPGWIVTRESRGDPTVINGGGHASSPYASGGRSWGCFQFMPGTWNSSCSDLTYDVAGQIECARRVSNGGKNLRPWALP